MYVCKVWPTLLPSDIVVSLFITKDQALSVIEPIGVQTIVCSQTNLSVGLFEEEEKDEENRITVV